MHDVLKTTHIQVLLYGSNGPAKNLPATTARYTFGTLEELVERVSRFKFEWNHIQAFNEGIVLIDMSKDEFMQKYVSCQSESY